MNREQVNDALLKVGIAVGTAFIGALSLFLSRILEPLIAWVSFTSMKLTIKLTKSKTLRSLYNDLREGYVEAKGGKYVGSNGGLDDKY